MKKIMQWSVAILLVVASISVASYPFFSNYFNSKNTDEKVVQYLDYVAKPPANRYQSIINNAREYNKKLIQNPVKFSDPFLDGENAPKDYYSQLSSDEIDVMATLSIPRIDVNLPVYHGTSDEVLKKGVGHLSSSSLPVGGFGSHSVLSAHTGSSSLKLFSDLNCLAINDIFYINCFGERMAYQVNQIKTVLPDDDTYIKIDPKKDYVTLVTCTPFGVNTHRLLVRGVRVDLEEAEKLTKNVNTAKSTWNSEYFNAILLGIGVMLAILLVYVLLRRVVRICKNLKRKRIATEESKIDE